MKKLLSILIASAIFLHSCKKDSGDDPVNPNPPLTPVTPVNSADTTLKSNAHIVDTTAISNVTSTSVNISKTSTSYRPVVGDIILVNPCLQSPYGMLSKVTAVSETSSQVVCTTVPSNLNEAFKQANINYSYRDTSSFFTFYRTGPRISINLSDANTLGNGLKLKGTLNLNILNTNFIYIKKDGALQPEYVLVSAEFDTEGSTLEITNADNTAKVFPGITGVYQLPDIPIAVPPLPFVFFVGHKVVMNTLAISVSAKGKWTILPKVSITAGFKYENGTWSSLNNVSLDPSAIPLVKGDFSPDLSLTATGTIADISYEVTPYRLEALKAFIKASNTMNLTLKPVTPNYSLKYKLDLSGGIKYNFWTGTTGEYSLSGNLVDKTIFEGNWAPIALTTAAASSVTRTGAISGGNLTDDGGSAIISRGVCWNTNTNPTVFNNKTSDGTGIGNFTSTLTGLTANTIYYLRAYAINITDTAYGNEVSFTTSPPVVPTLTTDNATAITATTASSGGNISNDGGAAITVRGVCWSTTANPTVANSKTSDGTGAGNFASSLTGLSAQTTYHIRAYATNSVGTAYGNDISFTTSPGVLATINTATITSVTITTAISGGNITNDGGVPITSRGVCWSTGPNPTIANGKTIDGSGPGSFTSSITGLIENTTYHIRAYATNNAGTAYGAEFIITTIAAALATVNTTSMSAITTTTATSGGTVSSDGGVTVTARGVCWSINPNPTIFNSKTIDGSGTGSFTSSLTGLTENTTYHVRGYATNSTGTAYGNDISFTTASSIDQVTIGPYTWMVKNLDVATYRNGDPIPQVTDPVAWGSLTTGAWCYYNNDPANAIYGKLYNWYAVIDPRGLAPAGWHISTAGEWFITRDHIGGANVAGGKLKSTGTDFWQSPNTGATNSSGFTGLPGGFRYSSNGGGFETIGQYGFWWATDFGGIAADFHLSHISSSLGFGGANADYGYSVRCVRD